MERCMAIAPEKVEARLIERCRQGDREAFRLLFDAHKDRVYSMALYALDGDANTAEDITQEVFVKVFTRIGQFRQEAEFATWLYRMVANSCIDELRRRRRFASSSDLELLPDRQESSFARIELTDSVQGALADLTPEQRATVLLKYFEQLSYDEMARVLDCSKGTVASRLNRSLKILAGKLGHLVGRAAEGGQ